MFSKLEILNMVLQLEGTYGKEQIQKVKFIAPS